VNLKKQQYRSLSLLNLLQDLSSGLEAVKQIIICKFELATGIGCSAWSTQRRFQFLFWKSEEHKIHTYAT